MADVTLRVKLATEQADRDAASFRDRLTSSLKTVNEGLDRVGKSQAVTATVASVALLAKGLEIAGRVVGRVASGLAEVTERAVDAGRASATFVRGLEDAQRAGDSLALTLGETISRSGAVQESLRAVTVAAKSLQTFFASEEGRAAVDGFFRGIATGAAVAIDTAYDLVTALQRVAATAQGELTRIRESFSGTFSGILGTLGGLGSIQIDEATLRRARGDVESQRPSAVGRIASAFASAARQAADIMGDAGAAGPEVDTGRRGVTSEAARKTAEANEARLRSQHEAERRQIELRDAYLRDGLVRQRELYEAEERIRADAFEIEMENEARRQRLREQQQVEAEARALDAMQRRQQELEAFSGVLQAGAEMISQSFATALTAGIDDQSFGETLRKAVGTAMVSMGTQIIASGLFAAFVGPIQGLLGNPAGFLAAALAPAAILAGGGMVAAGRAMGGGGMSISSSGAVQRGSSGGGVSSSAGSSAPQGYQARPRESQAPAVTVVVQGAIVGSAAELGRYVERALAASGRLRVGST